MIAWEVSCRDGGRGDLVPLRLDPLGFDKYDKPVSYECGPIRHNGPGDALTLVFSFFDPKDDPVRPHPEVVLDFTVEEFAAFPGASAAEAVFPAGLPLAGLKSANSKGEIEFTIPLVRAPQVMILLRADAEHRGVGAHPEEPVDLDIKVIRVYNTNQIVHPENSSKEIELSGVLPEEEHHFEAEEGGEG